MTKIINIIYLKDILLNFEYFLEKNEMSWKIINYNEISDFYTGVKFEDIKWVKNWLKRKKIYIENKELIKISENISENYENLAINDIYNLFPQILCKIYNFIIWDSEKINVDYYYILSWFLNFEPKTKKVIKFSDLQKDTKLFEEILFKVLDKIDTEYKKFEFTFELNFWNVLSWNISNISIDNRVIININENKELLIRWRYCKWFLLNKLESAFRDLMLIMNILEINKIIVIEDKNKAFWREKNYITEPLLKNCFLYSDNYDSSAYTKIAYFNKHLKNFNQLWIWTIDLEYFYLLSDKIKNTDLITASHFFWTDLFRFESQEFLSYWQSIEVMLWSPENNIKSELKSKFDLFFPKNNSIDKFWKIRNDIVHNWKLYVDSDILRDIEKISKKLFLKLVVSNYK